MGLLVLAATIIPETTAHQPPGHRHPLGLGLGRSSGWSPPWPGWSCPSPTSPRPRWPTPTFGRAVPAVRPRRSRCCASPRSASAWRSSSRSARRWPATAARWSRSRRLSVLAVLPLALAGHAAGSASHDTAVNSLAVHLVAVGPLGRRPARAWWCCARCWAGPRGERRALLHAGRLVLRPRSRCPASRTPGSALGSLSALELAVRRAGDRQGRRARASSGWPAWQPAPPSCVGRMATDEGARALFARLAVVELVVMGAAFGLATAPVPQRPARPRRWRGPSRPASRP